MASVILIHASEDEREALAAGLRGKGVEVSAVRDVEAGLEAADASPVAVVLVDPASLDSEEFEIQGRFDVRCGRPVRVILLAHLADPARRSALKRHGAVLLDRPATDLDALAATIATAAAIIPGAPSVETSALARMRVERLTATEQEPIDAPVGPDGLGPMVLIVDDDEECRELFSKILGRTGYRVHSVASANGALRFLHRPENKIDLIVSDICMPQVDGFELKQTLDQAGGQSIPFIGVSAFETAEQRHVAEKLGLAALVPKPIQARAFAVLVRSVLERTGQPV